MEKTERTLIHTSSSPAPLSLVPSARLRIYGACSRGFAHHSATLIDYNILKDSADSPNDTIDNVLKIAKDY